MVKETFYKLTGYNSIIDFSADAKFIIIGGYDGSFKVFDTTQNKICFKTKLKGSSSDVDVRHQDISFDNKYVAFSALQKVFVIDIAKKEIIWEFEHSKAERTTSSPFCFFHNSSHLVIPNGDNLLIYDVESGLSHSIALPYGAGWTDCIAINPNDTNVAYKSCNGTNDIRLDSNGNILSMVGNEDLSDKIFIYNIASGECEKIINIPYPPIRAMQISISKNMKFVDNETLLISRKTLGFSYFNIKSGIKTHFVDWQKKGFDFGRFESAKIYTNGRFVLFNNATPNPESIVYDSNGIATQYSVNIPDGLEYILFDIKEDKIIYRQKNGETPMTFHPDSKQFAYIKREYDENDKRTDYLCIREI